MLENMNMEKKKMHADLTEMSVFSCFSLKTKPV